MGGVPVFPVILTPANWQQEKGVVAKVFKGETGIDKLLRDLRIAYDAVEWQYFVPDFAGPLKKPRTREQLAERRQQAKGKAGQLEVFRKKCFATRDAMAKVRDSFKKSLVIPKSSALHVQKMMTACEQLALEAKSIDESGFERVQQEINRTEQVGLKMLNDWIKGVETNLPKVQKELTVAKYNEVLHQQVRGVGTAISKIPRYKAVYDRDWADMVGDGFMSNVKDGQPVAAKLKEVDDALDRLKIAMRG